jgi:hypothetical protein
MSRTTRIRKVKKRPRSYCQTDDDPMDIIIPKECDEINSNKGILKFKRKQLVELLSALDIKKSCNFRCILHDKDPDVCKIYECDGNYNVNKTEKSSYIS